MKNINFVPKPEAFYEKTAFQNFTIFTGKQPCSSLFFNKNADLQACNFIRGDCNTGVFLTIFRKIF